MPLRQALDRLSESVHVPVFLDRRVDPSRRVSLETSDEPVDEVLARLANEQGLGVAWMDGMAYVGPKRITRILPALASMRQKEVRRLLPELRIPLETTSQRNWPRLGEPRNIVEQLVGDAGFQLVGGERIPFDLWPQGKLPEMTLSDQLTVLLAGFDLTYRPEIETGAIVIVPIQNSDRLAEVATKSPLPRRSPVRKSQTAERYSLRVAEQPVGKVLGQLSERLGLAIELDRRSIDEAGLSLDRRVSFQVEDADLDQLLAALLEPAGMNFRRQGKQVQVFAERYAVEKSE